jgi:steroid delta-isomerase
MPTEEQMKSALQAYVDGFNSGDPAAVTGLFADDAVVVDPVGDPPMEGRAAIDEFYGNAVAAGAKLSLDAPIRGSHADRAAMAFTVTVPGMRVRVIDVMTFGPDGKIVRMEAYWGPGDVET